MLVGLGVADGLRVGVLAGVVGVVVWLAVLVQLAVAETVLLA